MRDENAGMTDFPGHVITVEPGRMERERARGARVRKLVILMLVALAAFALILWLLVRLQPQDSLKAPGAVDTFLRAP